MPRLALAIIVLLGATAAADDRWPPKGHCVASADGKRRCALRIKPADAEAIRAALLAWLTPDRVDAQPSLHRARELAERPITASRIGGYHLVTVRRVDRHDELMMTGSDWRHHRGFHAVVRPTKAGWIVLRVSLFSRHPRR